MQISWDTRKAYKISSLEIVSKYRLLRTHVTLSAGHYTERQPPSTWGGSLCKQVFMLVARAGMNEENYRFHKTQNFEINKKHFSKLFATYNRSIFNAHASELPMRKTITSAGFNFAILIPKQELPLKLRLLGI